MEARHGVRWPGLVGFRGVRRIRLEPAGGFRRCRRRIRVGDRRLRAGPLALVLACAAVIVLEGVSGDRKKNRPDPLARRYWCPHTLDMGTRRTAPAPKVVYISRPEWTGIMARRFDHLTTDERRERLLRRKRELRERIAARKAAGG